MIKNILIITILGEQIKLLDLFLESELTELNEFSELRKYSW